MNLKYLIILASVLGGSCFSRPDDEKHRVLQFRTIGHKLLLASGDSTSRILPVEKTNENTYKITFEHQFEIVPDSLANIFIAKLKNSDPNIQYRVSVYTCNKSQMVYGFEWSPKSTEDITCLGRKLPNNCYAVEIEIIKSNLLKTWFWLIILLGGLSVIAFYVLIKNRRSKTIISENNDDSLSLGVFKYYKNSALLVIKYQKIELSEKENKLLYFLFEKPNETVSRDFLLKEIWENEGVYVISRNLDVLVSKLRKKLAADPNIKITNSHSKGYKLEI